MSKNSRTILEHKKIKSQEYWDDLTSSPTKIYKEKAIRRLCDKYLKIIPNSILEFGCGSSDILKRFSERFNVNILMAVDYDKNVVDKLSKVNNGILYKCVDILDLKIDEKFDLVILLDIIHEVYSFNGKVEGGALIDHQSGVNAILKAFDNVFKIVSSKGGFILTDDLLCEENTTIRVLMKNIKVYEAVKYFLSNYPSRTIGVRFINNMEFLINSRDFCILLTQYNKIKKQYFDRWAIEKNEIHQYFTLSEYKTIFESSGFEFHAEVGTPRENLEEWKDDFKIVEGLGDFPNKRISILAIKIK